MKTGTFTAFLFLTLSCLCLFAEGTYDNGLLIVGTSSNAATPPLDKNISQEEAVLYEASELPISNYNSSSRADLLSGVPEQYRTYVEDFSSNELDTFMKKKKVFLDKFVSVMGKAKFSPEKIEKTIQAVDEQFYKSSRLLLQANATGGQHKFLIRTGFAVNTNFLKNTKIGKTNLLRYLSEKKGYFFLFAGGIGLSRIVDPETNKSHLILDLSVSLENLNSVSTFIAELVTADFLVLGLSTDVRRGNFNSIFFDKAKIEQTASYLGPAGRLVRSKSQLTFEFPFSIPFVTSIALPPLASGMAVFDTNVSVYRYSLNLTQLHPKKIAAKIQSLLFSRWKSNTACSAFYVN